MLLCAPLVPHPLLTMATSHTFIQRYQCEIGFTIPDRPIVVDDIRVRATGKGCSFQPRVLPSATSPPLFHCSFQPRVLLSATSPPVVETVAQCYFSNGFLETNVYVLDHMTSGHSVQGPCIIIAKIWLVWGRGVQSHDFR